MKPKKQTEYDVTNALLKDMERDNGCKFKVPDKLYDALVNAVAEMMTTDVQFTPDVIELIASGDQDEADERLGEVHGFELVREALSDILNNCEATQ